MKPNAATIIANGQRLEVQLPCTLAGFLNTRGWKTTQVVVELNGKILERRELSDVQLADGDRLEVIVPVAGG